MPAGAGLEATIHQVSSLDSLPRVKKSFDGLHHQADTLLFSSLGSA